MPKLSRTYRFDQETLEQIHWLGARLGGLDDTSVLRLAVAELYHRKQAEWKARLVRRADGAYDLQVHGLTLARVTGQAVSGLAARMGEGLQETEADGLSLLAQLLLGAAAAGEKVWLDDRVLGQLAASDGEPDLD